MAMNLEDYYQNKITPTKCVGKNCKRNGTNVLQIKLLQKKGIFCEECSQELIRLDLVEDNLNKNKLAKKMDDDITLRGGSRQTIRYSHTHGSEKN